ncbi:hypothetical protein [Myceligenerans pegani]|uniref:hypothetical protein n=1 Tax=Myceligenerans pegani TaxID=2776917 RepID=UPI001CF0356F|nr:hypothetical protein [Myceligenerans sp. TRM 65318]
MIMPGEVFPTRYVETAFRKKGIRDIDVRSFVDAAEAAYPSWIRSVIITRFVLATLGSILVITLLAVPS